VHFERFSRGWTTITVGGNVPGTDREYPNWRRKVSADIEDLAGRADLAAQFADIRAARQ